VELAVTDARVWPSPDEPISEPATILARDGVIVEIGPGVSVPAGTPVIAAAGRVVTSGFWNCHVHFTQGVWRGSRRGAASTLQPALDDMLLRRGFTTVLDLSSDPRNTLALARRIESGELRGPAIITAGSGLYPWRGIPYYIRENTPWYVRLFMPAPATAGGARRTVAAQVRGGAGLTKLFTGSYVAPGEVKPMRDAVARAAIEEAHRRGVRVFAHPSNLAGTAVAIEAGVDALAHVPDQADGTEDLLRAAASRGIRIVPTLHMFAATVTTDESYIAPIHQALHDFIGAGGRVLFGTDVGYLTEHDTHGEFTAMDGVGMSPAEILRSLTTEPAAFIGHADVGTVELGRRADLTILQTRDAPDAGDFARVHAVIRGGRAVYGDDVRERGPRLVDDTRQVP